MTVYADAVFAINLLVDYGLLAGTARLCGLQRRRKRLWLAAGLGAVYAVVCAVNLLPLLTWFPLRLAVSLGLCEAAFGRGRGRLRRWGVFFGLSACLGGLVVVLSMAAGDVVGHANGALFLHIPVLPVLLCAGGLYLALTLLGKLHTVEGKTVLARVKLGEKETSFSLLADTGCTLREPISGLPVLVAAPEVLAPILPEGLRADLAQNLAPEALVTRGESPLLRPVFCEGVAGKTVLTAFLPDRLTVNGGEVQAWVAIGKQLDGANGVWAVMDAQQVPQNKKRSDKP